MPKITHCIFDMDGLLINTEQVYSEVTQEVLDKYAPGKKFTWDFKAKLMGRIGHESAAMIVQHFQLPMTADEYMEISGKIQEQKFPFCKPLPGVERLIKHLSDHKIPIAVATSSTRSKFESKTTSCRDMFKLFDYIVCGDDADIKKGKPAPDIFLAAQSRLGNPPAENCLVFEDAINGIEAGLAANMHVIWIPDINLLEMNGKDNDHGAAQVLESMAHFDPEHFSLPAFKSNDHSKPTETITEKDFQ
ncbi:HAD-like domain-containing protein [Umbelopsis sp. PMI_123]|nr:HAD-like domain-containing protein [Umbelopsis sp. PMI_123]